MVLIPVHMGMHWCLAAVDFDTKCVSYYDSLHGNNTACLQRLRYIPPTPIACTCTVSLSLSLDVYIGSTTKFNIEHVKV